MKLNLFLAAAIALLLCSTLSYAAPARRKYVDTATYKKDTLTKVSYGIKAGLNMNQISGTETYKQDYVPGFSGGVFIASTRKKVGFRADAMVSSSRYNLVDDSSHHNAYFSLLYADITAVLEVQVLPWLWVHAGPQVSAFISVTEKPNSGGLDPKNYFASPNFATVGGVELRLPKKIILGARYVYGISDIRSDIATITTQAWTTKTIHAYIGYRIK